jgi:bla regulator protein BlaR1
MDTLNLNSVWVASLGWSLLHFLWQGAVIAGIAAVLLLMVGRARSQVRYVINCLALCLCPIWFGFELFSQLQMRKQEPVTATLVFGQTHMSNAAQVESSWSVLGVLQTWCAANLSTIVFIWCCAVFLLGIRMLIGWCWLRSFQTNQRGKLDPVWQTKVDALALRLQITRKVGLRLVDSLQSPVTMGMLKPFILLPTSLVSGMPAPMIEALLVHELAHIRRHDYTINFIQNLIELILFYHPVVWWLSKNIRTEREYIADEIASQVLAQPRQLALALKELEAFQFHSSQLSIAAHGGHLMSRISRLVKPEVKSSNWKAALLVVGLGAVFFTAAARSDVAVVRFENKKGDVILTNPIMTEVKVEHPIDVIKAQEVYAQNLKIEKNAELKETNLSMAESEKSTLKTNTNPEIIVEKIEEPQKVTPEKISEESKTYNEFIPAKIDFTQKECRPIYPKNSIRNLEQGVTVLKAYVNKDGTIDKVFLMKSSGFKALDEAIYEKLFDTACKMHVAKLNGVAIPVETVIEYKWQLD